jgi:hypothetical protein
MKKLLRAIAKPVMRRWYRWIYNMQRKARKRSLEEAIAKAKKITLETDKKVLIYFVQGEYQVMTKQEIKARWKDKQFIGYTVQQLEKFAELKIESYDKRKTTKAQGTTPGKKVVSANG